jgi:hypothetical protein
MAEIQYLDYFLYALQIIADDLGDLDGELTQDKGAGHHPSRAIGSRNLAFGLADVRNHEPGRGLYVCVPRNAVHFRLTTRCFGPMMRPCGEVLNEYRKKEAVPENIGDLRCCQGAPRFCARPRVTVVTYGACCGALRAAALLQTAGIDIEIIDVQTLLPFDLQGIILESIKKTSRVLFLDEDCPGGATAYMMQEVVERQGGFQWLDAAPRTLSAKPHRPAYGSDGDYFSKPNREQIVEMVYTMMREANPEKFPATLL